MDIKSEIKNLDYIRFMLAKQPKHVIEFEPRLMIHFRIKDRTKETDITAFEDVAIEIAGKNPDNFLQLENHGGTEGVSAALDSLIDNEYYFQARTGVFEDVNHQRTLTALAACLIDNSPAKRQRIGGQ